MLQESAHYVQSVQQEPALSLVDRLRNPAQPRVVAGLSLPQLQAILLLAPAFVVAGMQGFLWFWPLLACALALLALLRPLPPAFAETAPEQTRRLRQGFEHSPSAPEVEEWQVQWLRRVLLIKVFEAWGPLTGAQVQEHFLLRKRTLHRLEDSVLFVNMTRNAETEQWAGVMATLSVPQLMYLLDLKFEDKRFVPVHF